MISKLLTATAAALLASTVFAIAQTEPPQPGGTVRPEEPPQGSDTAQPRRSDQPDPRAPMQVRPQSPGTVGGAQSPMTNPNSPEAGPRQPGGTPPTQAPEGKQ